MLMKIFYALVAVVAIGIYAYAGFTGAELGRKKTGFAPRGSRGAQGGSRAFWYGGYRGGK